MTGSQLLEDPRTVTCFDSVACLFEWTRSMKPARRKRFLATSAECGDEGQDAVISLLAVVKAGGTTSAERKRAPMTIADALHLNPDEEGGRHGQDLAGSEAHGARHNAALAREVARMNTQEATFAGRLRELMDAKRLSQRELAERVGCTQPAISQMLGRRCRPQRGTILKLADALGVEPRDLWPDIEVADVLDAVAGFQQDAHVMTAAVGAALADATRPNRPKVRARSLPARP